MTRLGSVISDATTDLHLARLPRRYHFMLRDGETLLRDHKGIDLPNDQAALRYAQQLARGFKWIRWSIFVTDPEGNMIGKVG